METLDPRAQQLDGADSTTNASGSTTTAETRPAQGQHATPPARRGVPQALAIQLDELSTQETSLRSVWEQLTLHGALAIDTFSTATRHYLLLELPGRDRSAEAQLQAIDVEALQNYFLGTSQKVLAMDCATPHSTLSTRLAACLRAMGFDSRTAHAPPLLAAAAIAAAGRAQPAHARLTHMERASREISIISIPRLEQRSMHVFSKAELEIVRCLVDGMSHLQIAEKRKTAARTVANQVASAYRKLGVSGRSELLLRLATGEAA